MNSNNCKNNKIQDYYDFFSRVIVFLIVLLIVIPTVVFGKFVFNRTVSGSVTISQAKSTAIIDDGMTVNNKLRNIANNGSHSGNDTKIKAFKKANSLPSDFKPTYNNIISGSGSKNPIYTWFEPDGGIIYYYSVADIIYLNEDAYCMFSNMESLTDISGLSYIDASRAVNIGWIIVEIEDCMPTGWDGRGMFEGCSSLSDLTPISNWDVSNVISFGILFAGCTNLTNLNALSSWNTSSAKYMDCTFVDCTNLTDISGIANWDMSNVVAIDEMFYGCTNLTDISSLNSWNTSKVISMSDMFFKCAKATGTFTIKSNPVLYGGMFSRSATEPGSGITVNYSSAATNIDQIIATKSDNSNVVKGIQID